EIFGVDEQPQPAEAALDEPAEQQVGCALGSVGVVVEALTAGEVRFEPDSAEILPLPHADQPDAVTWRERDVVAATADTFCRTDVGVGAGHAERGSSERRHAL